MLHGGSLYHVDLSKINLKKIHNLWGFLGVTVIAKPHKNTFYLKLNSYFFSYVLLYGLSECGEICVLTSEGLMGVGLEFAREM